MQRILVLGQKKKEGILKPSVDAVQAIDWRDIEDPGERLRRRIKVEGYGFLPIMNMCCLHYCIEKGGGKEGCCDHECGALQPLL